MNIRALVIDDNVKADIERVIAFATRPDHYFEADKKPLPAPPGDDPRHVVRIPHEFRVVFSITRAEGKLYRHISISVPEKWPHPMACCAIAEEFGFTGFHLEDAQKEFDAGARHDPIPSDWLIAQHERDRAIIMCQELPRVN